MFTFRIYGSFCLCSEDPALFPQNAAACGSPFSPAVILVNRDPKVSSGLRSISAPCRLAEPEGPECLKAAEESGTTGNAELDRIILTQGATVLNTAFRHAFDQLSQPALQTRNDLTATIVGLGDVGGTVLTALKLLGKEFREIRIFDPYAPMMDRYEMELNQVLSADGGRMPVITKCSKEDLFRCDLFLFTASKGVPPVGSAVKDVRMAQFESNRILLDEYAKAARDSEFRGIFCQISDPVDHLAREVFLASNRNENGEYDFAGLLPEQVRGFGLGVMAARAAYFAGKKQIDFTNGRVYGPHGQGLVCANDHGDGYRDELSEELTVLTREANLRVRDLGFKPYIAPGLSSAAASILRMIRGSVHFGTVPIGGVNFGCRSTLTPSGLLPVTEPIHDALMVRIREAYDALRDFRYE